MGLITDLLREYPALNVAKERLALAQEKYDAVYSENEKLKAALAQAEAENDRLKTSLAELKQKTTGSLGSIEEKILKLLGHGDGRDLTVSQIGAQLNISKTKAEYYVNKLCDDEYLGYPLIMSVGEPDEPEIYLQQRGREYLIKNGLI